MNINSQEILLINKGLKYGEKSSISSPMNNQSQSALKDSSSVLNAMDMQGRNNIAFQGVNSSLMEKIRKNVSPKLLAGLLAVSVIAGSLPSCKPVEINQTVTIDLSALTAYFAQMNETLNKVLEELQISNELQTQVIENQQTTNSWLEDIYENGVATLDQVKTLNNNFTQGQIQIINILTAQGATQEEILEAINKYGAEFSNILQQLLDGSITFEDAVAQIEALLQDILNTVEDILEAVKNLSRQIASNHAEAMELENASFEMLQNLYGQSGINALYLAELLKNSNKLNDLVSELGLDVNQLIEIFTDEEKYQQFLEDLDSMNDDDMANFEAMLRQFGLTMMDFQNMTAEEIIEVLQNGFNNVVQGNQNIQNQLDIIIEQLDIVVENTSGMQEYYEQQNQHWNLALGELGEIKAEMDSIKQNQAITNLNLEDLKTEAQTANSYLFLLNQKYDDLKVSVDSLQAGGMTVEQFKEALAERDSLVAEEFEKFIEDYGFDQVPANQQITNELLEEIKNKIMDKEELAENLDAILAFGEQILEFIQNLDFSDPEQLEKLDRLIEILENFKCGCEHGDQDQTDESVEDLEDMFG